MTLYWNYIHDGGKPIQLITIEYRRDVDLSWKKIQISTTLKEYTVANLLPESFYQFRVSLKNEIGESYFSDDYDAETTKKGKILQTIFVFIFVFFSNLLYGSQTFLFAKR